MDNSSVMVRLARAVKLKNGTLYPAKYPVTVSPVPNAPAICDVTVKGYAQRVHWSRLFNGPARNLICAWIARGYSQSVIGERCQPGGFDRFGFPCWSLVYGMQLVRAC